NPSRTSSSIRNWWRSASDATRGWSGARTSSPAAIAATAPGWDRPRLTPTWSGRSSPRSPKARGSRPGNFGPESARLDAVAHRAEARIGVLPGIAARDPDHLQIGASAEAHPLCHGERGAAGGVPPGGEDLVTRLAAHPQWLGVFDADVLEVRNRGEEVARKGVALGALRRCAGGDGHQDVGLHCAFRSSRGGGGSVAQHDGAARD